MIEILIPFQVEGFKIKPEFTGRMRLSEDMQQTLAALTGYDTISRKLLKCSTSGILYTASPRIQDIIHVIADQDNYVYQGADLPVTEIMVMGHPTNTGLVYVKNDIAASADNGWPLAAKEVVGITLENLSNLHLFIASDTERAIVAYSR